MDGENDASALAAVGSFFAVYDRLWHELNLDGVLQLWDDADEEPIYAGEEYREPLRTWSALRDHYGRLESRLAWAEVTSRLHTCRLIAPGTVRTLLLVSWRLRGIEMTQPREGDCWVTALLRERTRGWRLFHYMEAPIYLPDDGFH